MLTRTRSRVSRSAATAPGLGPAPGCAPCLAAVSSVTSLLQAGGTGRLAPVAGRTAVTRPADGSLQFSAPARGSRYAARRRSYDLTRLPGGGAALPRGQAGVSSHLKV